MDNNNLKNDLTKCILCNRSKASANENEFVVWNEKNKGHDLYEIECLLCVFPYGCNEYILKTENESSDSYEPFCN